MSVETAASAPALDPSPDGTTLEPAIALRKTFRDGYGLRELRADIVAGTVVGVVALPLSMALAVAAGVPPQHGLYTAIVAGAVIAVLGGSRVQVSGPTAAFVVLLAPVSARFGIGGLLLATAMAGIALIALGLARLGRLIEFMPYPVTTGFTAGIAVVIGGLQIKDFLGLDAARQAEAFPERMLELARALPSVSPVDLGLGLLTLALLLLWPRLGLRVPAPIVALTVAALAGVAIAHLASGSFAPATLGSRFQFEIDGVVSHGVPRLPPAPHWPWRFGGPDGQPLVVSIATLRALAPSALAIAMLGAIESLLSAVIADGMIRRKHDPNAELLAQGVGNLVAPFFGGFAATGAIARTATNIRAGGRSPIAAVWHSVVVLAAMLVLAPWLRYLPMASLAALLLVVAWNLGEFRHVARALRTSPGADALVLLACFGLTVVFDMVVAVTAGVLLASLLFMRRMSEVTGVTLVAEPHRVLPRPVPPEVVVYEVAGPLFFGAAQKAMSVLHNVAPGVRVVLVDLRSVPAIDSTGLVNLESAIGRLRTVGVFTILGGVRQQPLLALRRAGWPEHSDWISIHESFDEALALAANGRL